MVRGLPFALVLLALGGGSGAAADPAALRGEVGRLRAELGLIRLAQAQQPDLRTAGLEVRLSRLEELLRQLTGRIEEVEYAQRRTSARIDELVADLDARLQGRSPAQEAGSAEAQTGAADPLERAARPSIVAPDDSARQGYVLGTIPQDALRGQPAARQPAAPEPPRPATEARLAPEEGADASYKQALDLLQAGRWGDAEGVFESFVQSYPDDARAPTASYWLGETYLFRKDYPTAASVFARNYRTYGQEAPRAPDNLLKLGMALAAMGDRDRACQTFDELGKRHPSASAPIRQAVTREKTAAGCS